MPEFTWVTAIKETLSIVREVVNHLVRIEHRLIAIEKAVARKAEELVPPPSGPEFNEQPSLGSPPLFVN